ncbi:hypothetical protein Bbelb_351300, partial [Branchiostoma belcheri]
YIRLSPRVKTIFQQYRYDVDNFHRRNRVYRAISGLLTYVSGMDFAAGHLAPITSTTRGRRSHVFVRDNEDLLDVVRDAYPSSEDVNWMLTNQDNRPTKEVGVEDLITLFQLWDDAAQCFNELEYSNLAPGHVLYGWHYDYQEQKKSHHNQDTVQAPVALGDPHLGVLIYPGQLIDADLVRDGASASGYHRRLMDFYFYFYGFPSPGKIRYIPVWSHSVVAARTARTLAMAAPVPVLRGDVTLVGCSLMEVWKKEDEDAAAEREEYREEWAIFEEDMAYLAHLERIMDAEDSSEDEVEEARRLYDVHVQIRFTRKRNIICPVVTDARCRASLESSVVSRDELKASAELIVSQDRCFPSTHVLYVDKHRCLMYGAADNMKDLFQQLGRAGRAMNQAHAVVYSHTVQRCDKQEQEDPDIVPSCSSSSSSDDSIDEDDDGVSAEEIRNQQKPASKAKKGANIINVGHSGEVRVDALLGRQLTGSRITLPGREQHPADAEIGVESQEALAYELRDRVVSRENREESRGRPLRSGAELLPQVGKLFSGGRVRDDGRSDPEAVLRSMEEDVHEQGSCWQEGGQASPEPDCPQHPSASVVRRGQMKAMEQRQPRRKYSRKPGTNMCSICGKPKLKEFGHSRFGRGTFCASSSLKGEATLGQNRLQENVNSDSSDTGFSDNESDMSGRMGHQPKENPTAMKDTGVPFRLMEGTGDDGKGSIRTWTQLNAVTTNEEVTPETPQGNTSVKFVPGPRTPETPQATTPPSSSYQDRAPQTGCEHLHELNESCKFSLLVVPRASIKYSDYLQDDSMTRQALEVIVENMITNQNWLACPTGIQQLDKSHDDLVKSKFDPLSAVTLGWEGGRRRPNPPPMGLDYAKTEMFQSLSLKRSSKSTGSKKLQTIKWAMVSVPNEGIIPMPARQIEAWKTASLGDHVDYVFCHARGSALFLGMTEYDRSFCGYIRPTLEYAAPCWSSALTQKQSDALERVQKRACRIILGRRNNSYTETLALLDLQRLADRREHLCSDFATSVDYLHASAPGFSLPYKFKKAIVNSVT